MRAHRLRRTTRDGKKGYILVPNDLDKLADKVANKVKQEPWPPVWSRDSHMQAMDKHMQELNRLWANTKLNPSKYLIASQQAWHKFGLAHRKYFNKGGEGEKYLPPAIETDKQIKEEPKTPKMVDVPKDIIVAALKQTALYKSGRFQGNIDSTNYVLEWIAMAL